MFNLNVSECVWFDLAVLIRNESTKPTMLIGTVNTLACRIDCIQFYVV